MTRDEKHMAFMEEFTALCEKYEVRLDGSNCCGCSSASIYDRENHAYIEISGVKREGKLYYWYSTEA